MPREEWLVPQRPAGLPPSPHAQARLEQLQQRKVGSLTVDVVDDGRTVRIHAPQRYVEVWRLQKGCSDLFELTEVFPFSDEPAPAPANDPDDLELLDECDGSGFIPGPGPAEQHPCPTCYPEEHDAWMAWLFGLESA